MKILIVEDEVRLARNIAKALSEVGNYAVDIATDGEDGLHKACTNAYDVIILDLLLPKIDGLTILKTMRSKGNRIPVLILTAKGRPDDVVSGLDLGSDDYLIKPFEMAELMASCRALIRRSYDRPDPIIRGGGLEIDPLKRIIRHKGREYVLPAMEYRLLEYLVMRAGEVVSKEDILDHLYDFDSEQFSNVIEVYISSLRKRFGADLIKTLRNQGYSICRQ